MLKLSAKELLEEQLARSMGLDRYAGIMEAARTSDVSTNKEFQRTFNGFYRVRRNAEWRESYYKIFERAKKNHETFGDVICSLYIQTGNIEASFTSKMIATIDPDKPIWDQYVLQNLGLEIKGKTPLERVNSAISIYDRIEQWYRDYLQTPEAKENIDEFDRMLPSYTWLTDVKKIDYLLWSRRDGTEIDE